MTRTGYLSRNRAADNCRVPSKSAERIGRTHRNSNFARVDFVIDNEAVPGQVIEIKTPATSSAEGLLLAMVKALAANSPSSGGDEQLLSLP